MMNIDILEKNKPQDLDPLYGWHSWQNGDVFAGSEPSRVFDEFMEWLPGGKNCNNAFEGGVLFNSTGRISPWKFVFEGRQDSISPEGFYNARYFDGDIPASPGQRFAGTYSFGRF